MTVHNYPRITPFTVKDEYGNTKSTPIGTRILAKVVNPVAYLMDRCDDLDNCDACYDGGQCVTDLFNGRAVIDLSIDGFPFTMDLTPGLCMALQEAVLASREAHGLTPGTILEIKLTGITRPAHDERPVRTFQVDIVPARYVDMVTNVARWSA